MSYSSSHSQYLAQCLTLTSRWVVSNCWTEQPSLNQGSGNGYGGWGLGYRNRRTYDCLRRGLGKREGRIP